MQVLCHSSKIVFPKNIPSQKAFENAGFVFDHAHEGGDAWYYSYSNRE